MTEWRYCSILDLGSKWRWVVSFILRSFNPKANSLQYSLYRRLAGSPDSVRTSRRREKSLDSVENLLLLLFHWLYSPLGPWPLFFSFMFILQTVGLLGRVISPSQGLYLNTGQHKHRINTYTHRTSMPSMGFEPTIPASERAKTVHALDRSATVTGSLLGIEPRFLGS
jgi:hypothetical protein